MELKNIPTWKLKSTEFNLERVLFNLKAIEEGPVTLFDVMNKKKQKK